MADFSKFKIGSTSYNVKDANAARSLDQPAKGMLALKNAANQQIDSTSLKLDGSLEDVTIDPATLANGDVVTYDANTQEWVNKPARGGGGSSASVLVLADASQWPVQSSNNLLHLIYQGDPATLLVIRNLYNSAVIPVSAYCITVNGGGVFAHYTDLTRLVDAEPVGTYFDLEVWLVAGVQSNQQHKITFTGVIDTGSTITLQGVSNFGQASVIGA